MHAFAQSRYFDQALISKDKNPFLENRNNLFQIKFWSFKAIPLDDCYFGAMMSKIEHSDDFGMGIMNPSYYFKPTVHAENCALGGLTVFHKLGSNQYVTEKFNQLHSQSNKACLEKRKKILEKNFKVDVNKLPNYHKHWSDSFEHFFSNKL